ncbi:MULTISPECIES: hypothetical protein [unclassified Streptomyces]|nr:MULTISPECIES: hypothetical protein [unclassified Streptomyces]
MAIGSSGLQSDSFVGPDAHWILEVRLVDEYRGFGGSFKQLLDLV